MPAPKLPYEWSNRDVTGLLPDILGPHDPRSVADQLKDNYSHGGGYIPFTPGSWKLDLNTWVLTYPGDPPLRPLAVTSINSSRVILYPAAFLVILEPDNTFNVTRVD